MPCRASPLSHLRRSTAPSCARASQCHRRLDRFLAIGERPNIAADDLARLVTFAGDDETIAVSERGNAFANGLRTIADLARAGTTGQNCAPDVCRHFAARIVVR